MTTRTVPGLSAGPSPAAPAAELPMDRAVGSHRLAALLTATAGAAPGYRALARGVRGLLLDGRVPLRTRLPAERELAAALAVSRATVTAAYDLLRESGHALSRRGAGTWTALPHTPGPAADGTPSNVAPPRQDGVVDLTVAAPAAPGTELADALAEAAPALARLGAGGGYHPYGLPELRAAVAEHYARRGLPTLPGQILVTAGAQLGISLVLGLLGGPGDRVLVETPSYPNALDAIRATGLRPLPVPLTGTGWDAELLETTLRAQAPRLAYVIPDFHNPTGLLMPREDRARLLGTARRTGTWLLVDETLSEIALDCRAPEPFAALARHSGAEQVVSVGSLSKTHWGGLRIGWVRAASRLVTELASARVPRDMASPVLDQLLAVRLLERTAPILADRLPALRENRSALEAALRARLPHWRWRTPPGGLSLWVDVGAPVASALSRAALAYGVRIGGGARFGADPGTYEGRLRLPYALPPATLTEAVDRLARALEAVQAGRGGGERGPHWVA